MKKIFKILFIILLISFNNPNITNATENSGVEIVSISEDNYYADIKIENPVYDVNNEVYVGQTLSQFNLICTVRHNDEFIDGVAKWEYNKFVIKKGKQLINIYFEEQSNKNKIRISICVEGIEKEAKHEQKNVYYVDHNDYVYERYIGTSLENIVPIYKFWSDNTKNIEGNMEYFNYEDLNIGYHEIVWRFKPNDSTYKTVEGIYKVKIISKPIKQISKVSEEITESTSLTATALMLTPDTSFDINIDNKESGSSYSWKSSNTKVAKVSKSGIVSAVSDGEAKISCAITDSNGKITELNSTVKVGVDDNLPVLSDNDLIIDVSDSYKLKVENKETGSTVKFTSSDKTIAKVSTSGKITTLKDGNCIVTATITKGTEVVVLSCNVSVES